jgi:hypothetical protein
MSFDPFAPGSELPPEYGPPPALPSADQTYARQRVQAPAIALIVVGILNLFAVGWFLFNVAVMGFTPANRLHEQMLEIYQGFPPMKAELNKKSPDELKNQALVVGWIIVALALVNTLVTIAGGVRMLSLKNYALCVCGAICASLPCLSGLACCGVGEIIGIWVLIVLLNPQVREAFQ